jgi:hypothetical protein
MLDVRPGWPMKSVPVDGAILILRYEQEARALLGSPGREAQVHGLRVDLGLTWRAVCQHDDQREGFPPLRRSTDDSSPRR